MNVIVDTLLAVICFSSSPSEPVTCHNALVGKNTPKGEFKLQLRRTDDPFYGGSILQFKETEKSVMGIHQTWLGNPSEQRQLRIKSSNVKYRINITNGCVNVEPVIYKKLLDCCSRAKISIR